MVSIDEELKLETLMTLSFLPSKRIFVIHQNKDSRKRVHVTCQGLASIIDFRPLLFSKGLNYILYISCPFNEWAKSKTVSWSFSFFQKYSKFMCPNSKKKVFSNIFVKSPHFVNKKRGGGENIVTMSLLSSNRLHTSLHVWLSKWDIMFLQQIISYLTRKEYSPLPHSALLKILILTVHNKIILKLTEKNVK